MEQTPQPQPGPAQYTPTFTAAPPRPTSSLAVVSLALGVASYVVIPVVGAIAAIVTGHMARGQIRRTGERGRGFATAGLILGYLHLVLAALLIALVIIVFIAWGESLKHAHG